MKVVALTVVMWLALPGVASAQTPTTFPCAPPVTVCESRRPTPVQTVTVSPTPTGAPSPTPSRPGEPAPTFEPATPSPSATIPSPTFSPSPSGSPAPVVTPSPARVPARLSLARPFGVSAFLLLSIPLSWLPRVFRRKTMTDSRRWRLLAAGSCLATAALVAFVGWYKISDEPLLNFQVPLLASAGMTVVLLAVLGGSLLVADQLRTDEQRIAELEDAVRTLASALEPYVEEPPRT